MKKLSYLMLLLPVLMMGCKKGTTDEPEAVKLALEPNSIICPAAGGDYTLMLTAPEAWTATCADSWVKVNPTSGNAGSIEISVKISANKESQESTSKIVFTAGEKSVEVPVRRLAKDQLALKILSETAIQTPKEGGSYIVNVESNIKWQISSNVSWAKIQGEAVKRNNAVITVNVDPATKPEETVATLTISPLEGSGIEKQTVTITRSASDATSMIIDKNKIDAPSGGGTYTVSVVTPVKWRAIKSKDASWLTLSNNEKTGSGTFNVKVEAATSETEEMSAVITVEEVRTDDYKPVQLNVLVTRAANVKGSFSVSKTKKVYFSKGNLQYQASTATWRFAEKQWDYIGNNNMNISQSYAGWIDLFGWGASGYNGREPYADANSTVDGTFGAYSTDHIEGTNYDWGLYCRISNGGNSSGMWRTLTNSEWVYLLCNRPNAAKRAAVGTVNNVHGLILLPDTWTMPSNLEQLFFNTGDWNKNKYSATEWVQMEGEGAVFLPAAGMRDQTYVKLPGEEGYYWTANSLSGTSKYAADYLWIRKTFNIDEEDTFSTWELNKTYLNKKYGLSVRLVQDVK